MIEDSGQMVDAINLLSHVKDSIYKWENKFQNVDITVDEILEKVNSYQKSYPSQLADETYHSYYFTFGHGQHNFPGYVHIIAKSESRARKIMNEAYPRWSMLYTNIESIHEKDRNKINTLVETK